MRLDVPPGRDDEITRLGNTLNDMLHSLEQALEHERRFVDDASHELRTPLTLLSSRVQLALRRYRTTEQHEAVLREISIDVAHLSRLADQLLALDRDERPAGDEPVDLADVTRRTAERHQVLAPGGSFYSVAGSLRVHVNGPQPVALGGAAVARVVDNLLHNAAVHGGPPVTVTVDDVGGLVRLSVSDGGEGIDAETLSRATQRFARAASARQRPGSGLGLALVESIVVRARGELRLCSGGIHQRFGTPMGTDCDHAAATTVTVLLPRLGTDTARLASQS